MNPKYWEGVYDKETPYYLNYSGTQLDDADTDGDGIRDGADDQDHDDVPNMMECSRVLAAGEAADPIDEEQGDPHRVVEGLRQPLQPVPAARQVAHVQGHPPGRQRVGAVQPRGRVLPHPVLALLESSSRLTPRPATWRASVVS